MSDTTDKAQDVQEAAPATPSQPPQQNHGFDQRRRLRELLSIPESQRSDPVWDEIIELEIQLAPGNRVGSVPPKSNGDRQGGPKQGGVPGGGNWKRNPGPGRKHPKSGGTGGGGGGKKPQGGPPVVG